jgi:ATP-dependent DNA helicase RecG
METGVDYDIREDRTSALPVSVRRIEELLVPFNPITTVVRGMYHFEYRTWPDIALREALMNAFCHADLRIAGPVMVKLHSNRLEIGNNGEFIGGINPDNILHHQPVARNPLLMDALTRLRLVNRTNLGINRMFTALLIEGKEPPIIRESGESVTLIFYKRELDAAFRHFVAEESSVDYIFEADNLIILLYLLKHPEMDTTMAARLCQRREGEIRETLVDMEQRGYIEHGGTGRGFYWCMRPELYNQLTSDGKADRRRRIDREAAKTRVLSILMERARRGERGLKNKEIRQITRYDRSQVTRLMRELRENHPHVRSMGHGAGATYEWHEH